MLTHFVVNTFYLDMLRPFLGSPDYVVTFPTMARTKPGPGSGRFAFSGPFQLLSEEGLRVVRSIVAREEHRSAPNTCIVYSRPCLSLFLYC